MTRSNRTNSIHNQSIAASELPALLGLFDGWEAKLGEDRWGGRTPLERLASYVVIGMALALILFWLWGVLTGRHVPVSFQDYWSE